MKRRYIEDLIFYWLALAFKGFLGLFPLRISVPLGAGLIYLLSFFYPRRFDVAYMNLKSAFPEKLPSEIKRTVRKSVFNLALSLMEFVLSFKLSKEELLNLIHIQGLEILEEEFKKEKGVIFLTAHYDNWELLSLVGAALGYPSFVIAREQKYFRLNNLLNRQRKRWGNVVVEKGLSLKKVIQALRKKRCIGILADQNAGKNGLQVKLFGKYASTNPGFISLGRSTQAVVLPVFLRRRGVLKHELIFYPPLDLKCGEREILSEYNKLLEYYIRKSPEQWLWFHKRWKNSPNKNILLLSDGKAGHFKQSYVVAEELKKILAEKISQEWGIAEEGLVRINEVAIKRGNPLKKNLLYLAGLFSSPRCQGCLRCLKLLLDKGTYKKLVSQKYDYIISAGSSLLGLSAILSYENRAVNINILNPGKLYRNKFKLILLPEHDSLRGENVVCYKGALGKRDVEEAESFLKVRKIRFDEIALKLGLLIGGEYKRHEMETDLIRKLISFIDILSQKRQINVLITTSRRTPRDIEDMIREFFKDKGYVKLLIIANQDNPPGGYEALLYSSDIIIVTSDSISMITEALEYGKKVYVYKSGGVVRKNEVFIKKLSQENLIKFITSEDLNEGLEFNKGSGEVGLSNIEIVQKALKMLL